ncbi:MAG: NTP transferase domain-containing protein [Burkholderiales bacterium]|nr:NTP transferase domain-containing protein [Burkholderiales bacterium]
MAARRFPQFAVPGPAVAAAPGGSALGVGGGLAERALPAVVVLAAGGIAVSARHEARQGLAGGSVLGATLAQALAAEMPVVLVTTDALAQEARRVLALRDIVVLPEGPLGLGQGMGYCMAVGVGVRPHANGWIMLPGDMPMVQPATLRAVAAQLAVHPVAYPTHRGRSGRPLGFAAELYSELIKLDSDDAPRKLCVRYPASGVEVEDPGVLLDVDTSDDLLAARRSLHLPVPPELPRSPDLPTAAR